MRRFWPRLSCICGCHGGCWSLGGADLYISWCQLAVPNKHDCDDVQSGLIQAPTQNPH